MASRTTARAADRFDCAVCLVVPHCGARQACSHHGVVRALDVSEASSAVACVQLLASFYDGETTWPALLRANTLRAVMTKALAPGVGRGELARRALLAAMDLTDDESEHDSSPGHDDDRSLGWRAVRRARARSLAQFPLPTLSALHTSLVSRALALVYRAFRVDDAQLCAIGRDARAGTGNDDEEADAAVRAQLLNDSCELCDAVGHALLVYVSESEWVDLTRAVVCTVAARPCRVRELTKPAKPFTDHFTTNFSQIMFGTPCDYRTATGGTALCMPIERFRPTK